MNLLIVDDEGLTREGLVSSISWEELGFTHIYQADDGINGLAAALKYCPEIVLCDVRMPRMDGIRMAERIREKLPDTIIIFMSGYSDKEYLKAAIKLKAINYVEKPLNPLEIRQAVQEGIHSHRKIQQSLRSEAYKNLENNASLALALTGPYEKNADSIRHLCGELGLTQMEKTWFTTFLIKILQEDYQNEDLLREIPKKTEAFLASYRMSLLSFERNRQYMIFHIYGSSKPMRQDLQEISGNFKALLAEYRRYCICHGESVPGINRASHSYESAVCLMQSSFFFDTGITLNAVSMSKKCLPEEITSFFSADYSTDFYDALISRDREYAEKLLDTLYGFFYENSQVLANQAKDLYYKFFTLLQNARRKMKMPEETQKGEPVETVISYLEQFASYQELHQALTQSTGKYFGEMSHVSEENPTIFLIKEYISKNYRNEKLSVKDISEHVYLSASYLCTLFKSETGKTLNQYIMEYRMEKAKKLLMDPRYKITDISARIGYSDGNYFGKSFKKATGLSPSEYREKMTK